VPRWSLAQHLQQVSLSRVVPGLQARLVPIAGSVAAAMTANSGDALVVEQGVYFFYNMAWSPSTNVTIVRSFMGAVFVAGSPLPAYSCAHPPSAAHALSYQAA